MSSHGAWAATKVCAIALLALAFASVASAGAPPSTAENRSTGVAYGFSADSANCSKTAATAVVKRLGLSYASPDYPVFKVLCGAFAGSGSEVMIASIYGPDNAGMVEWAVFRWSGSEWQLLMKQHRAAILTAAGSDIREAVPIYREGDRFCCPSGGTKTRIWHWNGARFTASAWKQKTPGAVATKKALVFSPSSTGGSCFMTDDGSFRGSFVYCWTGSERQPIRSVKMGLDGRLDLAATMPDLGEGKGGPPLRYGSQVTVGRFRCLSQRSGMRCTVIRSGKGFLFNNTGATRVGP